MEHLHEIICNNMYDFRHEIVERMQLVRSHEVELLQLADLLIGAVAYANRGLREQPGEARSRRPHARALQLQPHENDPLS